MEGHSGLIGVGTVHGDPAGFRLLSRRLALLRPDLILLEFSPYGRLYRKRRQREVLNVLWDNLRHASLQLGLPLKAAIRHPQVDAIRRQVCYPFEYRAARSFSRRYGVPVLLVDHSLFSMRWTLHWPKLVEVENLALLLQLPSQRLPISAQYRMAQGWLDPTGTQPRDPVFLLVEPESKAWSLRERFMAERIERVLAARRALRPVFVGGWWHLTPGRDVPTIRSLLGLKPAQCLLLRHPPPRDCIQLRGDSSEGEAIAGVEKMC